MSQGKLRARSLCPSHGQIPFGARFGKPTIAIYNGYDPDDAADTPMRKVERDKPLSILYVGAMYSGLRDPSILYEAIKRSGLTTRDVQVSYHGPSVKDIAPRAAEYNVSEFVALKPRVTYSDDSSLQRESDVLLLLQSPLDLLNVPAKVFEYFATRRPILGLGLDDGIPARLVRQRNAGLYVSEPGAVAEQLKRWVAEKRAKRYDRAVAGKREGRSIARRPARKLEAFLRSVTA